MEKWSKSHFVKIKILNNFASSIFSRCYCLHFQTLSLKLLRKFNFKFCRQIFIFRITVFGKMIASWTKRVYCWARRDLQRKVVRVHFVRCCLQVEKLEFLFLTLKFIIIFEVEDSFGGLRSLRQICSLICTWLRNTIKFVAGNIEVEGVDAWGKGGGGRRDRVGARCQLNIGTCYLLFCHWINSFLINFFVGRLIILRVLRDCEGF